jgi:hypothetical protein
VLDEPKYQIVASCCELKRDSKLYQKIKRFKTSLFTYKLLEKCFSFESSPNKPTKYIS